MSISQTTDYLRRIEDDLRRNILPFWIDRVLNRDGESFFGSITNNLIVDRAAERGALLTARILWTYSAAYSRYREPALLEMADHAYRDLELHFHDHIHGGYWWSVSAEGSVLRDRKQVYGQAFAVYALAEFHAATGRSEALEQAIAAYELIEAHARSRDGGYLEAFGRDWVPISDMRLSEVDRNEPKSQNTHLHIVEAYARLLSVWPDPALRVALSELVEVMLARIVDPVTGHLGLFFAEDWTLRFDRVSFGHDIEAAWLLTWAADVLQDAPLIARIRPLAVKMAETTLAEGVDSDGGVFNQGGPEGITDTNKEWWPQAEAVVGFLNAYKISRDERFLDAAFHTWDFIEERIIDRVHGEWIRGVTREGRTLESELKVGFWKCPYHNGRTGLEATRRLREISNQSKLTATPS